MRCCFMGDADMVEMNNLSNQELLELYDLISNHLSYLQESIIDLSAGGDDVGNDE